VAEANAQRDEFKELYTQVRGWGKVTCDGEPMRVKVWMNEARAG
jgi:hypothetical protein